MAGGPCRAWRWRPDPSRLRRARPPSPEHRRAIVRADSQGDEAVGAVLTRHHHGPPAGDGEQGEQGGCPDDRQRAGVVHERPTVLVTRRGAWRGRRRASALATVRGRWPSPRRRGCRRRSTPAVRTRPPRPARARRRRGPRSGTRAGKWCRSAWRTLPTAGSSARLSPKAAKSNSKPPTPRAPAEQPRPTDGDPVLLGVAAGHDVPVIGRGWGGEHLFTATVQPTAVRTLAARSSSSASGRRPATVSACRVAISARTAP